MSHARLCLLTLLVVAPLFACEEVSTVNDFDCEAVWTSRKGKVLSNKTLEYLQVPSEHVAVMRCKEAMLDAIPRGGKRAECVCVGRKAVPQ